MTDSTKSKLIHQELMLTICQKISLKKLPVILKGGTALLLCYGLNRHSEDLDFDSNKKNDLENIITDSAKKVGLKINTITLAKKTHKLKSYKVTYFL